LRIGLLIVFIGIFGIGAVAQSQSEPIYIIALTHLKKEKVKYIYPGKKVTLWYSEGKVRGRITAITAYNILIDNSIYTPGEILKIRAFMPGTTAAGAVMAAGGAGVLATGAYLTAECILMILEAEGESWAVFWGTLGLLGSATVAGIGAILVPVGIIVITQGRTFDVTGKWELSIIQAE
jgi:hypothetical protein